MTKHIILVIAVSYMGLVAASSSIQEHENLINSYWLTDKILIIRTGDTYPDQIAAVNCEKGIVIIDCGISPTLSIKYRQIIEKEFGHSNFKFVINTHHHFDHTNGNQVFYDAQIIAHKNSRQQMINFYENVDEFTSSRKERYQRRSKIMDSLDKNSGLYKRLRDLVITSEMMCNDFESVYELTLPTISIENSISLDMGDITLELIYFGPGFHTNNDIIVSIPQENVVFTGDVLRKDGTYTHLNSNMKFEPWVTALDKLFIDDSKIEKVVTNHDGILSFEFLRSFYDSLNLMKHDLQFKKNAVDTLEILCLELGINSGIEKFKENIINKTGEHFYLWEGDLTNYVSQFLEEKKYDDAIAVLKLHEEIFPLSTNGYYWRGHTYKEMGNIIKARMEYEKALKIDPLSSFAIDMIYSLK